MKTRNRHRVPENATLVLAGILLIGGCDSDPIESVPAPAVVGIARIETVDFSPSIDPMPAIPSPQQLEWQKGEMYMFIHFGINTYTGNKWGDGTDDPEIFNPTELDANQWVTVASEAGFEGVLITAKHHDGFSLWPTSYTDYSVSASPWKNGEGDVIREISDAALSAGIKFGIYLSPWDRHEATFSTPGYNDFFVGQLTELLTNYGGIYEFWFDGAIAPNSPPTGYDLDRWYRTVNEGQPESLIWGLVDLRWIGNEDGISPETQWSSVEGDRWFPAECDARNRPGWFWRQSEDDSVLSGRELLDIYFSSVGRNCVLLLNVPVDDRGLIPDVDIAELRVFRQLLDDIFDDNLVRPGTAVASTTGQDSTSWAAQNTIDEKDATFWVAKEGATSGWIEISLEDAITFNVISLQEPIQFGQRVSSYAIQAWDDSMGWVSVSTGTTIGYKKLDRLNSPVTTKKVRLEILDALGTPAIQEFALYYDDF